MDRTQLTFPKHSLHHMCLLSEQLLKPLDGWVMENLLTLGAQQFGKGQLRYQQMQESYGARNNTNTFFKPLKKPFHHKTDTTLAVSSSV